MTRRFARNLIGAALLTIGCGSLPTLRNKVGTGTNLQAVAEADLNRLCVFAKDGTFVSGPSWCVPCLHALHRQQDALALGRDAAKLAGRASWQEKRLDAERPAVEAACPTVNEVPK